MVTLINKTKSIFQIHLIILSHTITKQQEYIKHNTCVFRVSNRIHISTWNIIEHSLYVVNSKQPPTVHLQRLLPARSTVILVDTVTRCLTHCYLCPISSCTLNVTSYRTYRARGCEIFGKLPTTFVFERLRHCLWQVKLGILLVACICYFVEIRGALFCLQNW